MRKPVEPVRATKMDLRRVRVTYESLRSIVSNFTVEEQPFVELQFNYNGDIDAVLYMPEPQEHFNKRMTEYKRDLAKYEQYVSDNTPEKKSARAKERKECAKLEQQANLVKTIEEAQAKLEKLRNP